MPARRAAPVAALLGVLGPLAELDNVSCASRQCPRRLMGRQSREPFVCSARRRRWLTVTGRQSRPELRQSLVPQFKSYGAQDVGSAGPQYPQRLTGL